MRTASVGELADEPIGDYNLSERRTTDVGRRTPAWAHGSFLVRQRDWDDWLALVLRPADGLQASQSVATGRESMNGDICRPGSTGPRKRLRISPSTGARYPNRTAGVGKWRSAGGKGGSARAKGWAVLSRGCKRAVPRAHAWMASGTSMAPASRRRPLASRSEVAETRMSVRSSRIGGPETRMLVRSIRIGRPETRMLARSIRIGRAETRMLARSIRIGRANGGPALSFCSPEVQKRGPRGQKGGPRGLKGCPRAHAGMESGASMPASSRRRPMASRSEATETGMLVRSSRIGWPGRAMEAAETGMPLRSI